MWLPCCGSSHLLSVKDNLGRRKEFCHVPFYLSVASQMYDRVRRVSDVYGTSLSATGVDRRSASEGYFTYSFNPSSSPLPIKVKSCSRTGSSNKGQVYVPKYTCRRIQCKYTYVETDLIKGCRGTLSSFHSLGWTSEVVRRPLQLEYLYNNMLALILGSHKDPECCRCSHIRQPGSR